MKSVRYFIVLILSFAFLGCSEDIVETTGDIVGTVTDARTGETLSGVSLTLSSLGKSVTTGSDGRYTFAEIEAQSYNVQASKSGYQSIQKDVSVSVGAQATLDFQLTPSTGSLAVSQSGLDFGSNVTKLSLDLKNEGTAQLDWEVSESAVWLTCTPTSGSIPAGEMKSLVLTVNRTGLSKGSYDESLIISSNNGGSCIVMVHMEVQGIDVSVLPEELDFGSIESQMTFTVKNNSSVAVSYQLSTSLDWLSLNKRSGSLSSGASCIVSAEVNRSGLSVGNYSGIIKLVADDVLLDIPVRMSVPEKSAPQLSIGNVGEVTSSSATFHASIESLGSAYVTSYGFCWSKDEYPSVGSASSHNFGNTEKPLDFNYSVSDLEQSTTYYVRAFAVNKEGTAYSPQMSFTTLEKAVDITVTTGNVFDLYYRTAKITSTINNRSGHEIAECGVCWSVSGRPTLNDSYTSDIFHDNTFTTQLSGLILNTKYYARAFIKTNAGTLVYGNEVSFTTPEAQDEIIEREEFSEDEKWGPSNEDGGSVIVNKDGFEDDEDWNE